MNVMICFEVSGKLDQVRNDLSSKGYLSNWRITRGRDEITFNLPTAAMWKKGDKMTPAKAKEDLKNVAKHANVKIVRAVAVTIGKWDAFTGDAISSSVTESAEA